MVILEQVLLYSIEIMTRTINKCDLYCSSRTEMKLDNQERDLIV